MSIIKSDMGMGGKLNTRVIRAPKVHKARRFDTPLGRFIYTRDRGQGIMSNNQFISNLSALHRDGDGKLIQEYDLGSGVITNVGVDALANDRLWVAAATPFSILQSSNYHTTGSGATAGASTDYNIQGPGTHFGAGGTNNYWTGVQSTIAPNIYQTVATILYAGTEGVTEWGLAMSNASYFSKTSAGAAPTNTSFTDTGAAWTTAGNGLKGWTIEIGGPINTPATTAQALIVSNSATVATTAAGTGSGWTSLGNLGVALPSATVAYCIFPTMLDHKTFAVINVASGDSIQFTYQLTCVAGG